MDVFTEKTLNDGANFIKHSLFSMDTGYTDQIGLALSLYQKSEV